MATRITAIGRLDRQREVVIDVAGRAGGGGGRHVHASQREAGDAVIERSQIGPGDSVVAIRAVGSSKRGTRRGMHRVICRIPVGQVAELVAAIGRSRREVVAARGRGVALRALHAGVGIGQGEAGGGVVECGIRPARRVVAG